MRELRNDQSNALLQLREAVAQGFRERERARIVMQAPTGYGKTVLTAALVENARRKDKRVVITVPAINLVDQTVETLWDQGLRDIGVIQANHSMSNWSQPVQVCSVQTLQRHTKDEVDLKGIPRGDVVLVDECHIMFSLFMRWFTDLAWGKVPIIGLSATPWTKGLGNLYDELIVASTLHDLIERGLLSPFKVFAPTHPDLTKVRTTGGDFNLGQLSKKMNDAILIADVVQTWLTQAKGRPTLCFAVDRLHAQHIQAQFMAAGVKCGYQDGDTPDSDRKVLKRAFHNGDIEIVVNVGTLTTGVDWDVRCISCVRPTKSQMLFVQIIGRGLRTAPGKDHCLILDHSDNHDRLGFVTDIDASHAHLYCSTDRVTDTKANIRLPKECPKCHYMKRPGLAICPNCQHEVVAHCKIEPTPGELAELKRQAIEAKKPVPRLFYAELRRHAIAHGFKPGWAAVKFKEKFDTWPDRAFEGDAPALIVSTDTANWITSRNIAWARSKARQRMEAHR